METRQEFLNSISEVNPKYNLELLGKAYEIASKMHDGQLRKSGEPYLVHPIAVVKILVDLGMDEDTLVAGLLHDVVEDTEYTEEQLVEEFGEDVALLVDGVTKLGSIVLESKEERQAENLRKMFLAMSKDIRVIIIKLADRLHNLRTINYMTANKIQEKCTETLDIYAPLASRLGIYSIKFELEDIALKFLYPQIYEDLKTQISERKAEREEVLSKIMSDIDETLADMGLNYDIYGRTKHFYSIFCKMKYQHKNLDEIFDLMAVRIIVDSVKDCYAVLGLVHTMWKPIPGRFKDYIAMPKANMYQSLHTTVIDDYGSPFEIQIRTVEMHRVAEYGIAAHWKYKEGISKDGDEMKISWLRQTLEWQKDTDDATEFLEALKVDLFENQVFVFTPKGDVMELPAGATPLDFAFKVHSEVGAKCVGAKVNGKMVTIDHHLENGDIIEIVTSSNSSGPSIDWLKIAKSSTARTKIRQWLKKENKTDDIDKGKVVLDKYVRKKGYDPRVVITNNYLHKIVKEMNFNNIDELYTYISNGGTPVTKVAGRLFIIHNDTQSEEKKKEESIPNINTKGKKSSKTEEKGLIVKGIDGLLVRTSKCCNPVPGDEILGFTTKGRGVSVHRIDCPNIKNLPEKDKARLIEVQWEHGTNQSFEAEIMVVAEERKGLFSDISKVCDNMDAKMNGVNAKKDKEDKDIVNILLTLGILGIEQMEKLIINLKGIESVIKVYRSKL